MPVRHRLPVGKCVVGTEGQAWAVRMLLHLINVVPQRLHDVDLAGLRVPDVAYVVA